MRRYTIVNEPLTTARFSALYGVWYPHASDDRQFVQALLNECRATVLAKAAIRAVTPEAEFIQTEDICRVEARPALAERAAFYNARRWLSLDSPLRLCPAGPPVVELPAPLRSLRRRPPLLPDT